ncbi:MAG: hypothetical protein J6S69_10515 [Proteobacteria bacterium]|nr:hypothetical protein [Pseudomonadota bacterium]
MKRSALFCLALLPLFFHGCNSHEDYIYTCGNGVLDADEVCDGAYISSLANVMCTNGAAPDMNRVTCTSNCTLDTTWACFSTITTCGNGKLDGKEQCDGLNMPEVTANCANPDMSKLSCVNCQLHDSGVCTPENVQQPPTGNVQQPETWIPATCGNGQLDIGEWCDGNQIADAAKICPENMALKANPVFKCLNSCRMVDVRDACEYRAAAYCGDGIRSNDEQCDKTDFNTSLLAQLTCGSDENQYLDRVACTDTCEIDASDVCVPKVRYDVGVLISEVVPHLQVTQENMSIDGLAFELTNMSTENYDLSSCSLALIAETGIQKKYPLADLQVSSLEAYESVVICSYDKTEDIYAGACDAVISSDIMQEHLTHTAYVGVVCGDDNTIVDLFNYNSFIAAIQYGGVDFVRLCDAEPVTESQNALLGNAWFIDSTTSLAPSYGLGSHCDNLDSGVASCTFTVNRTTLENRGQTVELALEIKIPGQSDKTNKTDVSTGTQIQFITGSLNDGKVRKEIIHMTPVHPDTAWTHEDGIDRYIGTLRNWDTYEGFLEYETGTYVLDASISFDSGKTQVFCGPKGLVRNYEAYAASERNTLVVSYNDNGGICGDGIITASELCEGTTFRDEVMECENANEVVVSPEKVKCSNCTMVSTAQACAQKPTSCGNNITESPELCDGADIPATLKICPAGMVERLAPVWTCRDTCTGIVTAEACEQACGNGRLDTADGEICDASLYDHVAASADCHETATYDENRAACSATCMHETAACVPNTHLTIDEFIVQTHNNTPNAVAFALKYRGTSPLDVTHCTVSLIDANNKIIATPGYALGYFDFATMMQATETPVYLDPCKPFVICSEPAATQAEYKNVFNGACDAHLTLVDTSTSVTNPFIEYADKIAHIQLTCGGEFIDFFDYKGFISAMNNGFTHGKLKASDNRPWPNRMTTDLEKRMDLDKNFDLSSFASESCE